MDRRAFLSGTAAVLLAMPLAAGAQPAAKIRRVGVLSAVSPASPPSPSHVAFLQGLRELGYVEGENVAIDFRSAEGRLDRLPALARDLVGLKVDVIVTNGEAAIRAAKVATSTIPIVMAVVGDPVALKFVASLGRPGGNVTGLTNHNPGLEPKRLQLLSEAVPEATRIAVLSPGNRTLDPQYWQETQEAAQVLRVTLLSMEIRDPKDFSNVFARMSQDRVGGLIAFSDPFFYAHRRRMAELELKHRIPTIHDAREFVEVGSLMAYGPSIQDLFRRAAAYVDKILKGAKPADLPVEQPTKFELVINLKTAKALALTIPPSLLQRADEVIQ